MRRSLIVTLSLALTGFTAFCGYMAWYEYEGSNGSDCGAVLETFNSTNCILGCGGVRCLIDSICDMDDFKLRYTANDTIRCCLDGYFCTTVCEGQGLAC